MLVKRLFILILSFFLFSVVTADCAVNRTKSMPEGTFKKKKNGIIVQYDKNGKKIGEYKVGPGTYIKIK